MQLPMRIINNRPQRVVVRALGRSINRAKKPEASHRRLKAVSDEPSSHRTPLDIIIPHPLTRPNQKTLKPTTDTMRLLSHNVLRNAAKDVVEGFPLKIEATEVDVSLPCRVLDYGVGWIGYMDGMMDDVSEPVQCESSAALHVRHPPSIDWSLRIPVL